MSEDVKALEARLKAAQDRRRDIAAKHSDRRKLEQLQLDAAREEQAAIDDEAIANAEIQYGSDAVAIVRTGMGVILVRRPDAMHYKRFMDLDLGKMGTTEIDKLVRTCLIYPDHKRYDLITETLPAALNTALKACARLAGAVDAEISGKA